MIELCPYSPEYLPALAALFYETVHAVCNGEYTKEQLAAWATGTVDEESWNVSLLAHDTKLAFCGQLCVGFADMTKEGYLDRLYVHKDYLRQGIATALCDALEGACPAQRFTVHASLTALPFFLSRGYEIVRRERVSRYGVLLDRYLMQKNNPIG